MRRPDPTAASRDVGDQPVVERDLVHLTRYIAPINQDPVHFGHPQQRVLLQQAGQQPLGLHTIGVQGVRDQITRALAPTVVWPTLNRAHGSAVVMKGCMAGLVRSLSGRAHRRSPLPRCEADATRVGLGACDTVQRLGAAPTRYSPRSMLTAESIRQGADCLVGRLHGRRCGGSIGSKRAWAVHRAR